MKGMQTMNNKRRLPVFLLGFLVVGFIYGQDAHANNYQWNADGTSSYAPYSPPSSSPHSKPYTYDAQRYHGTTGYQAQQDYLSAEAARNTERQRREIHQNSGSHTQSSYVDPNHPYNFPVPMVTPEGKTVRCSNRSNTRLANGNEVQKGGKAL